MSIPHFTSPTQAMTAPGMTRLPTEPPFCDRRGIARDGRPIAVNKREAGRLIGVCSRTVERLIAADELETALVGKKSVRVLYGSLLAYIERRRGISAPRPAFRR